MSHRQDLERRNASNVRKHLTKAAKALKCLPDHLAGQVLGDGPLDALLRALLPPFKETGLKPYEFFQRHKHRSQLIAMLRHAIDQNYSVRGRLDDGREVRVSPSRIQWHEGGVMMLQGEKPFEGLFALIGDHEEASCVQFGIAARDIAKGGTVGPDAIRFVSVEEARNLEREKDDRQPRDVYEGAIRRLEELLSSRETEEQAYQEHLQSHPWMLGLEYERIERHTHLDESNIPDFTGVRARGQARDIIEIKPPFLDLFRKDDSASMVFMESWAQAERYLDFARTESDYLRRKSLVFENPKCVLLMGVSFSEIQRRAVRVKERNNPAISVLTYQDLLAYARHTLEFLDELGNARSASPETSDGCED